MAGPASTLKPLSV